MEAKANPILRLNDTFSSYQELRNAVERYEKANRVQFWTRDAKRLHRASPSVYQMVKDNPELEYCSLKLSCIHGGKAFQEKKNMFAKSRRKSRGTWKQDCKAEIFVKLNDEKNRLIISRMEEEHNHDIPTAEVFKQFPKLRRSSEKRRIAKRNLYQSRFHEKLHEADGVRLENIVKANSMARSKNFEKIARLLREKYFCTVDLQSDENDKVYGFFFQDCQMKKSFELFPEILLLDGTYRLLNINCFIYVLSAEDAMGICNVVGIAVLTVEDKTSIDWMLARFKERNPHWTNTSIIISDIQTTEYKVPEEHFPDSLNIICASHALYTFKKDMRQVKSLNITPSEAAESVESFEKLINSNCEEEYGNILEDMEDNMPYSVTQYFYKKWHDLRYAWVKGLGAKIRTHIDTKLEDPNSKFRASISSCKTFSFFIEKLFLSLYLRRAELKNEFNKMVLKVSGCFSETEKAYDKFLTPFAFEKIKSSLSLVEQQVLKTDYFFKTEASDVICQSKTSDNTFVVSEYSCVCTFFTVLKLPCEHVLMYRKLQKMTLFDEYLFSQRWTRRHMQALFEVEVLDVKTETEEKSGEEKFEEAEAVCVSLATLCSEASAEEFEERIGLLTQLKRSWQNRDTVVIHTFEYANKMEVERKCEPDEDCKTEHIVFEVTS